MNTTTYKELRNLKFNEILEKMKKSENKALTSAYTFVVKETLTSYEKIQISNTSDAYNYIKQLHDETHMYQETFFAIYLNRANETLGYQKISSGNSFATIVDNKFVIKGALDLMATGIILTHNHPSGQLSASEADKKLTTNIKFCCETFGIKLLDHIITTPAGYLSMQSAGEM